MREEKNTKKGKRNYKRIAHSIKEWAIAIFETLLIMSIAILIISFICDQIQTQITINNSNQSEKEITLDSGKVVTYSLKKGNLKVTLNNKTLIFSGKYREAAVNPDGKLYLISLDSAAKIIDLNDMRCHPLS